MKLLTSFLLAALLIVQAPQAQASPVEDELRLQLLAIAEYLQHNLGVYTPLTADEMRQIILDGATWTVAAQEKTGHFGYEYAPFAGEYLEGEGMVRQAGTLFMLSEVYKYQQEKDPAIAKAIEQAIEYFESISAERESDEGVFWCIKNQEQSSTCELGSASLALIGALNYVATEPAKKSSYEEAIERYVTYLLAAKFSDRGFSGRYHLQRGFSENESPFYNGEAMLALVRYYQYAPDDQLKELLQELFAHLSGQEYESPLYLWIMAALKDMQRLWPDETYVAYAADFTQERLDSAARRHHTTHNYCAPLEGLVSAYSILEGNSTLPELMRLSDEIDFWLRKSNWLQLDAASPYRVVWQDGQLQLLWQVEPTIAHGGFLTDEGVLTQRIDFTQHCVSAYLQKLVDVDREEL
ncbi:hypothetical protein KC906_00965 [Candidatus Kaiserbacteria bacterium]|nr:hypothetical protein [Candidatus Kaiserbacteria bacterium]